MVAMIASRGLLPYWPVHAITIYLRAGRLYLVLSRCAGSSNICTMCSTRRSAWEIACARGVAGISAWTNGIKHTHTHTTRQAARAARPACPACPLAPLACPRICITAVDNLPKKKAEKLCCSMVKQPRRESVQFIGIGSNMYILRNNFLLALAKRETFLSDYNREIYVSRVRCPGQTLTCWS